MVPISIAICVYIFEIIPQQKESELRSELNRVEDMIDEIHMIIPLESLCPDQKDVLHQSIQDYWTAFNYKENKELDIDEALNLAKHARKSLYKTFVEAGKATSAR
ncbi:unnamed protein product [marine sediment metagenome]|uniref:Uncharacterized protein n=1 Tax=marine sediment metagenome TaxID=412755 RepID=X1LIU8_9ZZZZ